MVKLICKIHDRDLLERAKIYTKGEHAHASHR